jgi:hypothetical protein
MKTSLAALALLVGLTGIASSKTNWEGKVVVIAVSEDCAGVESVGDHYTSAYQPANNATILDNVDGQHYWSFIGQRNGFAIQFPTPIVGGSVQYQGFLISSRGHTTTDVGQLGALSITDTGGAPIAITPTTPTVFIDATVTDWVNTVDCTATLRGAFVKRPQE